MLAAVKSGFFQLTRLSKVKGCLKYDDWIDCLSGGLGWIAERLAINPLSEAKVRHEERLRAELEACEEGIFGKRRNPANSWSAKITTEKP
mgnify:CR=1 FL=1